MYVGTWLTAKVINVSLDEPERLEFILLEVQIKLEKILVACVYRPPHVCHMDIVMDAIFPNLMNYKYTVLCDVNARFGSNSAETAIINELFFLCNLECTPYGPTYHIGSCDSNLDIIASNCQDHLLDFGQVLALGFSHHDLLFPVYNIKTPI